MEDGKQLEVRKVVGMSMQDRKTLKKHTKLDSMSEFKPKELTATTIKINETNTVSSYQDPEDLEGSQKQKHNSKEQPLLDPLKSYEHQYKIILLGTASSGKTSLLIRFVDDHFNMEGQMNTIGMDLKSLSLQVEDKSVRLQIWDTQGQEQFFAMTRSYFRNCSGAVVVFDLTNQKSLDAVEKYIVVFKEECPEDALDNIVLVGTKLDDVENRQVKREDAMEISARFGCQGYYETSSQTGEGVDEAFFALAARAFQKSHQRAESKARSGS